MHMLYHVPDIPAAIGKVSRITKPGGTVQVSTNSPAHLAEINDLMDTAIATQFGRPAQALPPLRFTTENGATMRGREFASVTLHAYEVLLSIPSAEPVIAYIASIRDPSRAHVGGAAGLLRGARRHCRAGRAGHPVREQLPRHHPHGRLRLLLEPVPLDERPLSGRGGIMADITRLMVKAMSFLAFWSLRDSQVQAACVTNPIHFRYVSGDWNRRRAQ